ncbi:MAG TPA: MotA/TolQ/ExbB proton channel family protein [Opitutus sp.]|nr:MotA/TolQ/ExbB proton channel family protein [Opitutus sp.]
MRLRIPLIMLALAAGRAATAAESFEQAMTSAAQDYQARLQAASAELNRTRERIANEKAPLLREMRAAEDRIIAAETEVTRLETAESNGAEQRRQLLKELDGLRKQTSYVATLAHDSLKAFESGLTPGAEPLLGERLAALQQAFDGNAGANGAVAADAAEFLLAQTERELGGYAAAGSAVEAESNQVLKGTLAFVGPESYFLPQGGGWAGTVRARTGSPLPVVYALRDWKPAEAEAFFGGGDGSIIADASGGKALRLKETNGTVWDHIRKGGVMAFVIIFVGLGALAMIVGKVSDVRGMRLDPADKIRAFLRTVAAGDWDEAKRALGSLRPVTAELFGVGLESADQPKAILEEHLQAVLLEQRLHYERRLPLLAVIATAAPLMGLLGTVIGMVKTFALITVFGTGNAAKLSSGISEVLVATELGLTVAIPTLVMHGFLAHRIQKNLSQLQRHALQFVTAVETAKLAAEKDEEPVPA